MCLYEEARADRQTLFDGAEARHPGERGARGAGSGRGAGLGSGPPGGVVVPGWRHVPVSRGSGLVMRLLVPSPAFLPGVLSLISVRPSPDPVTGASPPGRRPRAIAPFLPGWLPASPISAGVVRLGVRVMPPVSCPMGAAGASGDFCLTAPLIHSCPPVARRRPWRSFAWQRAACGLLRPSRQQGRTFSAVLPQA